MENDITCKNAVFNIVVHSFKNINTSALRNIARTFHNPDRCAHPISRPLCQRFERNEKLRRIANYTEIWLLEFNNLFTVLLWHVRPGNPNCSSVGACQYETWIQLHQTWYWLQDGTKTRNSYSYSYSILNLRSRLDFNWDHCRSKWHRTYRTPRPLA